MTGYLLLDEARALPQGLDLYIESWPRPGATAWAWQRGSGRALLLRGQEPVPQLLPLAQTPQGAQLGARILACQSRHGAVAYITTENTAICHDCHAPWLWAVPWTPDAAP